MKCVLCKGELKEKIIEYNEFGISFGKFPAKVCTKCGESYFEGNIVDDIQKKSREFGLFGLKRDVKIAKVGNSLAIRIPKKIAEFLKLKAGEETSVYPDNKRLIIETKS